MITQELLGYMRGELAKGKTREEIHAELVKNGGWSEVDLNEAFRTVIPMQGFAQSSMQNSSVAKMQSSSSMSSSSSLWKILLIIVILCLLGFGFWLYRASLSSLWNSLVNKMPETTVNTQPIANNNVIVPIAPQVKDCGTSTAPDLKNSFSYNGNAVLTCLGNSALYCEDAKAVLNNALFPDVFQIVRDQSTGQNTCNFRLSYGPDSTLVDAKGRKLAGQYIVCPVSIVKAVDETKKVPSFSAPSTGDLSKYASQIYFYGTLGLFVENNLDKSKMEALGCSGSYIDSVIASYNKI